LVSGFFGSAEGAMSRRAQPGRNGCCGTAATVLGTYLALTWDLFGTGLGFGHEQTRQGGAMAGARREARRGAA
jgi:hypothetical protein